MKKGKENGFCENEKQEGLLQDLKMLKLTRLFTQRKSTAMKIELIRLFMSDSFSGTR